MIPVPAFVAEVVEPLPNRIFLSVISKSVALTLTVVPLTVKLPSITALPVTSKSVPTQSFLAIAAPPSTVNYPPAVALVASVVELKFTAPVTSNVPE